MQSVIDSKTCAAAYIYAPPKAFNPIDNRVKIAFDADAVLFSEESELRYKTEGIDAFQQYEEEHENDPLKEGPFAKLLIKLSKFKNISQQGSNYHHSDRNRHSKKCTFSYESD